MKPILVAVSVAALVLLHTGSLVAQDEATLRKTFEGKRVTVKIEMPASEEGVDIFPGTDRPINFPKLAGRLKKYGTALREGESALVTKVKVKSGVIEIHLGGGGYGTAGDIFGGITSNRAADSGSAQQMKKANERAIRAAAGSRFNLRYPHDAQPEDLTPESVVRALAEYATFSGVVLAAPPAPAVSNGATEVRKGQSADDVQRILGSPTSSSGSGPMTTNVYKSASGSGTVEVDYYNGVVVDVRQGDAGSVATIRKGMALEDLERIAGKPFESKTSGPVTSNKYRWQDGVLEADIVNGVLVSYRILSN